jgi:hypothetical protein
LSREALKIIFLLLYGQDFCIVISQEKNAAMTLSRQHPVAGLGVHDPFDPSASAVCDPYFVNHQETD